MPTARRGKASEWAPGRDSLDSAVTLDGRGRFPREVLNELCGMSGESAGFEIKGSDTLFNRFPRSRVRERFEQAAAEAVLRSVIAASGQGCRWSLRRGLSQDEKEETTPLRIEVDSLLALSEARRDALCLCVNRGSHGGDPFIGPLLEPVSGL